MSEFNEYESEIQESWNVGCSTLIPAKSRDRYENTYQSFKDWCTRKSTIICEKSLLAYFVRRNEVGMILGIAGALRREELYKMRVEDIEDRDGLIIVKVPLTKTYIQQSFVVINEPNEKVQYLNTYNKYKNLRPKNFTSSHFLNYRNGKCTNQVIGKGTIGTWPCKVAEYLVLNNPASYTGHSFRRSSATLLANTGEDILGLKRHGGWKSSNTAVGYVGDSVENKIKFANKILYNDNKEEFSKPSTSTCNEEEKENVMDEKFDNVGFGRSSVMLDEFPDNANILSSTSVLQNSFLWQLAVVIIVTSTFISRNK